MKSIQVVHDGEISSDEYMESNIYDTLIKAGKTPEEAKKDVDKYMDYLIHRGLWRDYKGILKTETKV